MDTSFLRGKESVIAFLILEKKIAYLAVSGIVEIMLRIIKF